MSDQDLAGADVTAIADLLRDGLDDLGSGDSALGHAVHRAVEGHLDDAVASFSNRM